jgi:hypothetical protein
MREWTKIDCDKTNLYPVLAGYRQHRVGAQSPLPDIFAKWQNSNLEIEGVVRGQSAGAQIASSLS